MHGSEERTLTSVTGDSRCSTPATRSAHRTLVQPLFVPCCFSTASASGTHCIVLPFIQTTNAGNWGYRQHCHSKKRRSILHFSALFRTFRSLIPLPYYSSPFFQRRFYSCYQTFFSTGGLFLLSITCACRLLLQNLDETSNENKSPLKKLPPLRGRTKVAKVGPPRARVKTQIC